MRITVRVTTGAAADEVVERGDVWRVRVRARPEAGRANAAIASTIAKALGVPKSRVQIVRGASLRNKVLSVDIE